MRLSRQSEIAIDLLVECAIHNGLPRKTKDVAARISTTHYHAQQVVSQLSRADVLTGIRGMGGGIRLARGADDITVGEIVRLFEPGFGARKLSVRSSELGKVCDAALAAAFAVFDGVTIATFAAKRLASLETVETLDRQDCGPGADESLPGSCTASPWQRFRPPDDRSPEAAGLSRRR